MKKLTVIKIAIGMLSLMQLPIALAVEKNCSGSWSVKAKGLNIGKTAESIVIKGDGSFHLKSEFIPNGGMSILGVPHIMRNTIGNPGHKMKFRDEKFTKFNTTKLHVWKNVSGTQWQKSVDETDEEPVNISNPVIDSTMLPYVNMMGLIKKDSPNNFNVVGKGAPYPIVLTMEPIEGENPARKWQMNSTVDNGIIYLDGDMLPTAFKATQEGATVEGTRTSWKCD